MLHVVSEYLRDIWRVWELHLHKGRQGVCQQRNEAEKAFAVILLVRTLSIQINLSLT
jgi:hypothetical protein